MRTATRAARGCVCVERSYWQKSPHVCVCVCEISKPLRCTHTHTLYSWIHSRCVFVLSNSARRPIAPHSLPILMMHFALLLLLLLLYVCTNWNLICNPYTLYRVSLSLPSSYNNCRFSLSSCCCTPGSTRRESVKTFSSLQARPTLSRPFVFCVHIEAGAAAAFAPASIAVAARNLTHASAWLCYSPLPALCTTCNCCWRRCHLWSSLALRVVSVLNSLCLSLSL